MLKITLFVAASASGCAHHDAHHAVHHGMHDAYSMPIVTQPQMQPTYVDAQGQPVYVDAQGQPVYSDGRPVDPAAIESSAAPGQVAPVIAPTVIVAPPAVIHHPDHHDVHHDTHHDDHH